MALKPLMLLALAASPATLRYGHGARRQAARGIAGRLAALPEGVDPGFLIKDSNGCYGIVIELAPEGQPQTGPALLDANGQQVCDT